MKGEASQRCNFLSATNLLFDFGGLEMKEKKLMRGEMQEGLKINDTTETKPKSSSCSSLKYVC